jgi:hypothetical protein
MNAPWFLLCETQKEPSASVSAQPRNPKPDAMTRASGRAAPEAELTLPQSC